MSPRALRAPCVRTGQPHPADVAEPASLAATRPPACVYPLLDSLPTELISSGKLSCLQLEAIGLACQRHLTVMPTAPHQLVGSVESNAGSS